MTDAEYIRRSLELARKGAGLTSPGAMVGAVIAKDDEILGEGFYTYDGVSHAEVLALRQAGPAARGSTVYVSLEPCSHFGRTPPCANALIDAGVTRVVVAIQDPNPEVNGKGLSLLRNAGVEVQSGVMESEARTLNEAFITYKTKRRPFGILKIAMTLDGKIATAAGESQWITSEESRGKVHLIRHFCDAIITGAGTFLKDSPRLTDRSGLPRRRDLLRVILDRRGRVQDRPDLLVFRASLEALTKELYDRQIQSFVLECGPDLAFNALQAGVIDKIVTFVAPKILGGHEIPAVGGIGIERLADAIGLTSWSVETAGPDLVITSYVHRNH
jgi:diaminohydroxyphosphoribosylaminopyrimidine deaminase/5-amino-6-(5-phosphoribosylamino)uracil reductase